jgi:hypothetical protein
MNTMNMPGFTADASFYRSSAHYQASAMFAAPRQEGQGGNLSFQIFQRLQCRGGCACLYHLRRGVRLLHLFGSVGRSIGRFIYMFLGGRNQLTVIQRLCLADHPRDNHPTV